MLAHETKPRRVDTAPSAYVTKNKQRIKQYNNDTVFLNNGDEFEIELFNPTSNKFLAKIELNGTSIGSGVVLRPGERVFLERYLDVAKKFLFETYSVEGDNDTVQKAIANNGKLKVQFYKENIPTVNWNAPITWITNTTPVWTPDYRYYDTNNTLNSTASGTYNINSTLTNANTVSAGTTQMFNTMNFTGQGDETLGFYDAKVQTKSFDEPRTRLKGKSSLKKETIETGRIEKGSHSNQNFIMDSSSFQYYRSYETTWKILPMSQKVFVKEDIKVFCTACGAKRKKESFKFCPMCGNKF